MSCSNFCTAAKCEELEHRINTLEFQIQTLESYIDLLRLSLEGHTLQPIPMAHDYEPLVTVDVVINQNEETTENQLKVDVSIDNINAYGSAILPNNSIDFLDLRILDTGNNNYVFELYINDLIANTELQLAEPQINLDVFDLGDNNFGISMTVGSLQAQDSLSITLPEEEEHVVSNLKLSGSNYNDYLTLTVADGESSDSTQIFIDAVTINRFGGGGQLECDLTPVLTAIDAARNEILNDTQEIKKIFQAREEVFSYCIQDLDANLNNSLSNNGNNIVLGHS